MTQQQLRTTLETFDQRLATTEQELRRLADDLRSGDIPSRRDLDARLTAVRDDLRSVVRLVAFLHEKFDRILSLLEQLFREPGGTRLVH